MKNVRFAQVVARSGRPHVHTLWLAPEKDSELRRAQKEHRVMTVLHGTDGGKADAGLVGFEPSKRNASQVLIFPRSLARFTDRHVVGIKFDLVEQPTLTGTRGLKISPPKNARGKRAPRPIAKAAAQSSPARAEDPRIVPFTVPPKGRPARTIPTPDDSALVREIRAAMRDLTNGKAVAAYQRLEHAIEPSEKRH